MQDQRLWPPASGGQSLAGGALPAPRPCDPCRPHDTPSTRNIYLHRYHTVHAHARTHRHPRRRRRSPLPRRAIPHAACGRIAPEGGQRGSSRHRVAGVTGDPGMATQVLSRSKSSEQRGRSGNGCTGGGAPPVLLTLSGAYGVPAHVQAGTRTCISAHRPGRAAAVTG